LKLGLFGNARRRSSDVERTHGELRARLADGLRGDDADRFAHLDGRSGGQVTSVAARASPTTTLARQHRANFDPLNTRSLNLVGQLFADFLVHVDNHVAFIVANLVE